MNSNKLALGILLRGTVTEAEKAMLEGVMNRTELNPSLIALRILLKGAPNKADFLDTLIWVSGLADMAAETLLKGELTNRELYLVMVYSKGHRRAAWEKFLQQNPTNAELLRIFEHISALRNDAFEQLLKQSPTQDELIKIVELRAESFFPQVWEVLRESADEEGLLKIYDMRRGRWEPDPLCIQAAERLLEIGCGIESLLRISYIVDKAQAPVTDVDRDLHTRAVERLLEIEAPISELQYVVQLASLDHRERICARFMQSEENRVHYLIKVVEHSEALRQQAAETLMVWKGLDENQERWVTAAVAMYYPPLRKKAWNRYLANNPKTEQFDDLMWKAHKAGVIDLSFRETVARKVLEAPRPSYYAKGGRCEAGVIRLIRGEYKNVLQPAVVRRMPQRQAARR